MDASGEAPAPGTVLAAWATQSNNRSAAHPSSAGTRFAFYGRVSTEDHQDPATSKAWQLLRAQALTSGHGRVVAEFFDVGHSRLLPWARRPDAAALIAALADPDRSFDAIVIGSSERAFYGQQFATMAPLFAHYGVAMWVPELGGEVDPSLTAHDELMVLLGILSKREVARARMRARTSMTVQARDHGRYLGGRPPYGYRLVDAGPHPNRALGRRGVRLQRLDIDPTNGPVVTWMFQQRLAGRSMARITRALNDMKVPCPSAADRARNPHRTAGAWTLPAVRAVLGNPRYTGRQVWNRQRTDHDLIDPDNTTLGHRDVQRRNTPDEWVISEKPAPRPWSVRPTSSPRRTSASARAHPSTAISSPGYCAVGAADAAWSPAGPTATPPTAADTATRAPRPATRTGCRTRTSAKTRSSPTCQRFTWCSPAKTPHRIPRVRSHGSARTASS